MALCGVDQRNLPFVPDVGNGSQHGMRRLAVQCGIQVGPSGQHQGIHTLHQGIGGGWIVQRGGNDWYKPCVLQGCKVGRSQMRIRYVEFAADRGTNRYNRTE